MVQKQYGSLKNYTSISKSRLFESRNVGSEASGLLLSCHHHPFSNDNLKNMSHLRSFQDFVLLLVLKSN